jgi:hypothetical protein
MPEREYEARLDGAGENWLRYRFETRNGRVVRFLVQYETTIDGERTPVTRYDDAHGQPHVDILTPNGEVAAKRWLLGLTSSQALGDGEADLRTNWRTYRRRFLGA